MTAHGVGPVLVGSPVTTGGQSSRSALPAVTALADKHKAAAIGDYLRRLNRAQTWVYKHPEAWAKAWAQATGLPEDVALASVKRSNGTRVPSPSTTPRSPPSRRSPTPSRS
jgi:sulfonate transport system substrate-binding protein